MIVFMGIYMYVQDHSDMGRSNKYFFSVITPRLSHGPRQHLQLSSPDHTVKVNVYHKLICIIYLCVFFVCVETSVQTTSFCICFMVPPRGETSQHVSRSTLQHREISRMFNNPATEL